MDPSSNWRIVRTKLKSPDGNLIERSIKYQAAGPDELASDLPTKLIISIDGKEIELYDFLIWDSSPLVLVPFTLDLYGFSGLAASHTTLAPTAWLRSAAGSCRGIFAHKATQKSFTVACYYNQIP